jgi:hypothetical protein
VEEATDDAHDVELHLGEDVGDFERMDEIGLAGASQLAAMFPGGENVGAAEKLHVAIRMVRTDFLQDILEADHGIRRRRKPPALSRLLPRPMIGFALARIKGFVFEAGRLAKEV